MKYSEALAELKKYFETESQMNNWLTTPHKFSETPLDLLARGEYDTVLDMAYNRLPIDTEQLDNIGPGSNQRPIRLNVRPEDDILMVDIMNTDYDVSALKSR